MCYIIDYVNSISSYISQYDELDTVVDQWVTRGQHVNGYTNNQPILLHDGIE